VNDKARRIQTCSTRGEGSEPATFVFNAQVLTIRPQKQPHNHAKTTFSLNCVPTVRIAQHEIAQFGHIKYIQFFVQNKFGAGA
jgi:hypothetical protein